MKKVLTTMAIMSLASSAVMAAGPTMYGKLHLSTDYMDNNGSSADVSSYDGWQLNSNSSRIGVKGSEDLGNGMKVGYLIEWNVDMDGGNDDNNLTARNRAITLSGDWGTALAGRWDTPFKTVGRKLDLFGDKIGDTRNLTEMDDRENNTVAYSTPNMNGFSATGAYVFDESNDSDNDAYSVNGIYANGALEAMIAWTRVNGGSGQETTDAYRIGGSYRFGDAKVLASYDDYSGLGHIKDNDPSVWTVGGSYTLGNNDLKLQYSDRDESDSGMKDGADMTTIGIDHNYSKRTQMYAAYSMVSNDSNARLVSWGGGHGNNVHGVAGEDADVFSLGVIHKF